jgi:hypothetical protein
MRHGNNDAVTAAHPPSDCLALSILCPYLSQNTTGFIRPIALDLETFRAGPANDPVHDVPLAPAPALSPGAPLAKPNRGNGCNQRAARDQVAGVHGRKPSRLHGSSRGTLPNPAPERGEATLWPWGCACAIVVSGSLNIRGGSVAIKIQWPRRDIDVVRAQLDAANVRLGLGNKATQAEIINDLFANEDAMEIIESIESAGYFSQETPIAVIDNGVPLILEGNRRIAALKALANPGLVPRFEDRIRRSIIALGGDVDELLFVPADIAPSRDQAEKVIASIHTVTTRKPWPPLRQAAFYYAQVDSGKKTAAQLADEYPNVDIPYFIKMWEMHKVVVSADYPSPEIASFAGSRKFPITTLERIYRSPEVQEKLKYSFGADGSLKVESDPKAFASAIATVVTGFHDKSINSRVLNEKSGAGFNSLVGSLPNLKRTGKASTASAFTPKAAATSTSVRTSVVPKGFTSSSSHPGVQKRLAELGSLNAGRYPHAALDLTRTLLECSLKAYFDDVKNPIPVSTKPGSFVMLSHALNHSVEHFTNVDPVKRLAQVSKIIRDGVSSGSMPLAEILNAANHNYSTVYTRQDAQDCWDKIQDLMAVILNPPKL